ncbi:MAG TPA: glycosyltransferase family 4 protein [Luteitalea sp.]|nr:glycosyltransferase family 4 protein [Luteitalea sp.]
MPPVRVLQITSYPPPRAGWGVRVEHVRRRLERDGHTCDVLNMGANRRIKSPDYVDVQGGSDYARKVWRFVRQGYLVHAHLNGDSPKGLVLTLLALLLQLAGGRRAVITFHAGPLQKYFPQERSWLFAPSYWLVFALSSHIVCNSDVVKQRIMGYGVRAEKISAIPAFSRQYLEFERVALTDTLERFFADRDPVICSYVFFRTEFFIPAMIDAVQRLVRQFPNLGLVIMGSDKDSAPTVEQIARLGLQAHVLLAGDQPHDQFLTIMTRSRLYVRTPPKDGVCSSVLEALALGVPVVGSANGTRPPGVVTFTPNDADDLAMKVAHVLTHEADVRAGLVRPDIRDTVEDEATLLVTCASRGVRRS